jgi:hypothetical protein
MHIVLGHRDLHLLGQVVDLVRVGDPQIRCD